MRRTLAIATITGALLAGTAGLAEAREGNAPLTHYSGWHRLVDDTGASDWAYADPNSDPAMTLGGGVRIEMRWGGRCTDPGTGQLRVARLGHHVFCG
jgi:hypothetical protein